MALILEIKTEWSSHTLELKEGESIVLGRSPEANIQIPRPSVSQQHLRVTWTGDELLFEDLKSSNGTYRMPQDSPFVEARLPSRGAQITLKLSKSLVDFSWHIREATSTMALDPTRTEFAPQDLTMRLGDTLNEATVALANPLEGAEPIKPAGTPAPTPKPAARTEQPPAARASDVTNIAKKVQSLLHEPKEKTDESEVQAPGLETKIKAVLDAPQREIAPETATTSAAWIAIAALTGVAFLLSFVLGRAVLQGIVSAHGAQLRNGGMVDVLIIWGGMLANRPVVAALLFLGSLAVWGLILRRFLGGRPALITRLAARLQGMRWAPVWPARAVAAAFLVLFYFWPLGWASIYQTPPNVVVDAIRFWRVLNRPAGTASERIVQLRALLPRLQGSSLLYKEMFLMQRQRILEECKGVGTEAPWEDKKVCLVLLTAVAIESLEEVQPGLLGDVAARAAILLSLDGISRVIGVEGLEAPTIPFFLNSLDAVGLGPEREDIEKLIFREGATGEEVLDSLLELRKRIELRLEARQLEMGLPRIFSMRFPSPIESGI